MIYWKGNECIGISSDPCHKRKGLYVGNRYCIQRVATFANDEFAEDFDMFLCRFLGLKWEQRIET